MLRFVQLLNLLAWIAFALVVIKSRKLSSMMDEMMHRMSPTKRWLLLPVNSFLIAGVAYGAMYYFYDFFRAYAPTGVGWIFVIILHILFPSYLFIVTASATAPVNKIVTISASTIIVFWLNSLWVTYNQVKYPTPMTEAYRGKVYFVLAVLCLVAGLLARLSLTKEAGTIRKGEVTGSG
jgi:hypothetical protein